jgi:hypothetical protein
MVEIFIPRAIYDASCRFIPPAASDKSIFFSLSAQACSNAPPFGKLKISQCPIQFSRTAFCAKALSFGALPPKFSTLGAWQKA